MLLEDRTQHGHADRRWQLFIALRLVVPGVTHVCLDDRLELIGMQPRGELRQLTVERPAPEWLKNEVLGRDSDVRLIHDELEVHRAGGITRAALGLPALHEQ